MLNTQMGLSIRTSQAKKADIILRYVHPQHSGFEGKRWSRVAALRWTGCLSRRPCLPSKEIGPADRSEGHCHDYA